VLRRLIIDTIYRLGTPPWDTPPPEELREVIEGPDALVPGKALDIGCGSGANVIYLANHGWQATGVDFSPVAIRIARDAARAVPNAHFIEGDAANLTQLDIAQPIDLAIDMGGYHSLPQDAKPVYVAQLASLLRPGTPVLMWQGIGLKPGEIPDVFSRYFVIEDSKPKEFVIKRKFFSRRVNGRWYWLRRR
jgi:SAM-dependent methyltransferase